MKPRIVPEAIRLQQQAASDPAASVWVSANAGSGKTHVLAQRVLRLLLGGTPPGRVLCLTFTKAAAANMAARIYRDLSRWTQLDDAELRAALEATGLSRPASDDLKLARRLFARAVETPGGLKIQTIHAFCERLLHLFPFEANVPARFEVLDEAHSADLMARAKADTLAAAASDAGQIGRDLRFIAGETSAGEAAASTFDAILREALGQRALMRQPHSDAVLRDALGVAPGLDAAEVDRAIIEDGFSPRRWAELAARLDGNGSRDNKRAALFRSAGEAYRQQPDDPNARARCRDLYLDIFFTQDKKAAAQLVSKATERLHPGLADAFAAEQQRLVALEETRRAVMTCERTRALFSIVEAVLATYDRLKAARGLLDFADLVGRTLTLLDRSDAQWVLYKLDSGIDHILVDEAQDTSEPQWRVFEALTADFASGHGATPKTRTFFAVGDDKQSIFSFQGAAPLMFHDMRDRFGQRFTKGGRTFRHIPLKASFRSAPGILKAVDALFEPKAHQRGLVHGDIWPTHEAVKNDLPGLVEIWPPQGPAVVVDPEDWRLPLDALTAEDPASLVAGRIAEKIAALIDSRSGERVHDEERDGLRPIRPSDVLILVRTRSAFFTAVIRALKAAGVPVAGADRLQLGAPYRDARSRRRRAGRTLPRRRPDTRVRTQIAASRSRRQRSDGARSVPDRQPVRRAVDIGGSAPSRGPGEAHDMAGARRGGLAFCLLHGAAERRRRASRARSAHRHRSARRRRRIHPSDARFRGEIPSLAAEFPRIVRCRGASKSSAIWRRRTMPSAS